MTTVDTGDRFKQSKSYVNDENAVVAQFPLEPTHKKITWLYQQVASALHQHARQAVFAGILRVRRAGGTPQTAVSADRAIFTHLLVLGLKDDVIAVKDC